MIRSFYTRATAPANTAITYAQAADHLRVDSSADQAYIEALIGVATEYVEGVTGQCAARATYTMQGPSWGSLTNGGKVIRVLRAPLVSVESIQYFAPGQSQATTISSNDYRVTIGCVPGAIHFLGDLPDVDERVDAVKVNFTAGYAAGAVPPTLQHAIKFLVAHLYETRTPINVGNIVNNVPMTIEALVQNLRLSSFFA